MRSCEETKGVGITSGRRDLLERCRRIFLNALLPGTIRRDSRSTMMTYTHAMKHEIPSEFSFMHADFNILLDTSRAMVQRGFPETNRIGNMRGF